MFLDRFCSIVCEFAKVVTSQKLMLIGALSMDILVTPVLVHRDTEAAGPILPHMVCLSL